MSKIICDICGTTYQDTAECCPICGCSRDTAASLLGDDLLEPIVEEEPKGKGGRFSSNKKKKEIFDYDEVNTPPGAPDQEENPFDEDEEEDDAYEDGPRHNTLAVVILTVLIALLLIAAAFLFVRYYLPNLGAAETTATTQATDAATTAATTELTVPCQSLVLTSGSASGTAELTTEGQFFLLHVVATPEDTTDVITYQSGDESIATVSDDGRITAVGEGETVIYITCGSVQITCPVVCSFVEETIATEATVTETEAEEVEENEETTATVNADVVLKLKKTDIKLGVYLQYQLELDCDLEQTDVEWSSEHSYIASVDEEGWVTALQTGTTSITAKYGDQEVSCIVRCG